MIMVTLTLTTIQVCPKSLTWQVLDYDDRLALMQKNQKEFILVYLATQL